MIKRIIGILATVGMLAVMVMVVVNHKQYKSLIESEPEVIEVQLDTAALNKIMQADSVQVETAPTVDTLAFEKADSLTK